MTIRQIEPQNRGLTRITDKESPLEQSMLVHMCHRCTLIRIIVNHSLQEEVGSIRPFEIRYLDETGLPVQ